MSRIPTITLLTLLTACASDPTELVTEAPRDSDEAEPSPMGDLLVEMVSPAPDTIWSLSSDQIVAVETDASEDAEIVWTSHREGVVAHGSTTAIDLSEGIHRLTVTVTEPDGTTASATRRVEVQCTEWDLWTGHGSETCFAETVSLPIEVDVGVSAYGSNPTSPRMSIDRDLEAAYLRLDLSDLPEDAAILDANLEVWSSSGYAWGGNGWTQIRFVADDDWPAELSWAGRPAADAEPVGGWFLWYNHNPVDMASLLHNPAFVDVVDRERRGDGRLSLELTSPGYSVDFHTTETDDPQMRPRLHVRLAHGEVVPGHGDVTGTGTVVIEGLRSSRAWSDGTFARACWDYRHPADPERAYDGLTGTGRYRIDPDGEGGFAPFDVWCDMETDGGGWTLVDNDAEEAASFTERTPGANADPTVTRGAYLPDYAWSVAPQLMCRSSHSLATTDWLTVDVNRLTHGVENRALTYPTQDPDVRRWNNGYSLAETNGLVRSDAIRIETTTNAPGLQLLSDAGRVCSCNGGGGVVSGVGEVVPATESTCSTWVR